MLNFNLFRVILISLALSFNASAKEWNYKFDPTHSNVTWEAGHFDFSMQSGKFTFVEGEIFFNEKKPAKSKVIAKISIANLKTGDDKFNKHLNSKDFFNSKKFKLATFKSNKIKITGKNTGRIIGELTLMGVSKRVVLTAKFNKIGINPVSNKKTIGFSANAIIKRSDFGMNSFLPGISDKVKIAIQIEANAID